MTIDPYRPLFLLGLLSGFVGVFLWPLFLAGQIAYPMQVHSHLMLSVMFLSFVSGFLMTALPRMSGTAHAHSWEVFAATGILGSSVLFSLFGFSSAASAMTVAQIIFLLVFGARRILKRGQNPPPGFMFIPVGLIWCLYGSAISIFAELRFELPEGMVSLGKVAIQQAFLLNLIIGLGSRLIPFLSRISVVDPSNQSKESYGKSFSVLLALNLTFLFELWLPYSLVALLRFLIFAYVAIYLFRIFQRAEQRSYLSIGLRLAVASISLALLLLGFLPNYQLALFHVLFIGGYALLTLMVATRVVLAHGGHGTQRELTSPSLGWVAGLMILAMALRAFYFLPWAAGVWLLALCIWLISVGRYLWVS